MHKVYTITYFTPRKSTIFFQNHILTILLLGKYDEFDMSDLENTTVVEGNVVEVAMALTDVTGELEAGGITTDDIRNIAEVIVNIVDVESNDSRVSKGFILVI